MPAKKVLKEEKPKAVRTVRKKVEKPAEPVINLTEAINDAKSEGGMISSGGVEIIGLLGLVTLIYATGLLYLMY